MKKLKKTILAISMLSAVWGGFFFPVQLPVAWAYGGGTQAERYPQTVTAAAYCVSCTTPPSAATAARTGS